MSKNIKSYVMFDTESTGLPSPGNNPRITEMCLIALTREEIKSKQRDYRVFNKLHLCINPCKQIHHRSSELTGLHNDSLSLQATFSKQADLIVSFLRNLPQPTCILAHNGHRFDFPLLKAELKKSHKALSENVHCADTLEAFRMFDGLPPVPDFILQLESQQKLQQISKDIKESTSPSFISNVSTVSSENNKNNNDTLSNDRKSLDTTLTGNKRGSDCLMTSDEGTIKEMKVESANGLQYRQQQKTNEVTPNRKTTAHSSLQQHHNVHTARLNEINQCQNSSDDLEHLSNVRKRLFTSPKLSLKSNGPNISCNDSDIVQDTSFSSSLEHNVSINANDTAEAECDDSTQSYLIPDSSMESSFESSQIQHIQLDSSHSISDSDKHFLEACKEVDLLLPHVSSEENSGSRTKMEESISSEFKQSSDRSTTSHQSENPKILPNKIDDIQNISQQVVIQDKDVKKKVEPKQSYNVDLKRSSSPEDKKTNYSTKTETNTLCSAYYSKAAATQSNFSSGRKSYSLVNLYIYHFGQRPETSHTAEDDCKTLLRLISLNVDKFISYCDQNAVLFSGIEPMY